MPWAAVLVLAAAVLLWESRRPATDAPNPLAGARFTRLTDFPGFEQDAAISPDGRFVAFLSDRDGQFGVWFGQIGTGRFTKVIQVGPQLSGLPVFTRKLGFSADGSEIWLGGGPDRRLRLIPATGGTPRFFLGELAINVAWSPDGSRLVYQTRDDGDPIFVADRMGGNVRKIFVTESGGHNHFLVWSPDGSWIYFVRGTQAPEQGDVWRIRAAGGEAERLTQHNNVVRHLTVLDPRTLVYVALDADGSGPWLWALDVDRKATRRVTIGLEKYTSLSASAEGRRLVATVSNPTAGLWSVPILDRPAEERDVRPVSVPTVRALAPRFGGTALFYLSARGTGDGFVAVSGRRGAGNLEGCRWRPLRSARGVAGWT